jgi:hypothetical protein
VLLYVLTNGGAGYDDVVYHFAEEVGISPVTADRYLRKMTSEAGPLMIVHIGKGSSKGLQIRPEYWETEAAATGETILPKGNNEESTQA